MIRFLTIFSITCLSCAFSARPAACAEQPNIILILADDLGWADLGCYGETFFETPNLDRLAGESVRFSCGYAASCVCSPTRSSIMTGKYPARNDLTIWLGGSGGAPAVDHMSLDEITIAESLKQGGYATAHVGKWHLGGEPYFPQHQGFDLNIAGTHAGSPAGGYHLPNKMHLDEMQPGDYLTDRLTDECLGVIERWQNRPFFIYMAYHTVHTPIQGRKDLVDYYRKKLEPDEKHNCEYAAMVHCLDENVGRVLAKLDELKLDEQTVVIFFSDNGGYSHSRGQKNNVTTNEPLRLGKGYCYEGGHREPAIVRYPPLTGEGGVCDVPIVSTDFYPTALELAGLSPRPDQHADGVSIVPLLKDPRQGRLERDTIYWHYPHNSPQGGKPSGAIRQGDWKLLEFFADGRLELYNLAEDLSEKNDLAAKQPDRVEQLHVNLKAWRLDVNAKMPLKVEPAKPVLEATKSFPGFDTLIDVELKKHESGYELAAQEGGFALHKSPEPLTGPVTFRTKITPLQGHPANGLLVFGDSNQASEVVKCGFFVSGRYAAIYEGSYPSADIAKIDLVTPSGVPLDVVVTFDPQSSTIEMALGGKTVTKKLTRPMEAITHYGYGVVRTRSAFEAVTVEAKH